MPWFEFEVTKKFEIVTTIKVKAPDEDKAEEELKKKIAGGLADNITLTIPEGWDTSVDETDYQLR